MLWRYRVRIGVKILPSYVNTRRCSLDVQHKSFVIVRMRVLFDAKFATSFFHPAQLLRLLPYPARVTYIGVRVTRINIVLLSLASSRYKISYACIRYKTTFYLYLILYRACRELQNRLPIMPFGVTSVTPVVYLSLSIFLSCSSRVVDTVLNHSLGDFIRTRMTRAPSRYVIS